MSLAKRSNFELLVMNWKADMLSGFLVSLIALPLSLGIAKASDFPPVVGILTAIIGGLATIFFTNSQLTIKGPAAGLIVISAGAVSEYGGGVVGWQASAFTILCAGVMQYLFGRLKLGSLAGFFPTAAVHGMLAAIGLIIISKQIPILLGINPIVLKGKEPLELIRLIPYSILHENSHITEVGLSALIILILLSLVKQKPIRQIPPPLIVLIVSIPLGYILHLKTDGAVASFAMVKIGNVADILGMNVTLNPILNNPGIFVKYLVMFSLVGSIESLLTAKAIDGMDPYKRNTDFNRDLEAAGIGNVLSGAIGGLFMISEVARSSANVNNGGVSKWSNFFHGAFLLLYLLIAVPLIEMIPNAALAALLLFVGFRLAHPKEFVHFYKLGKEQFIPFVGTVFVTLTSDLLIGVAIGIVLEIIICLVKGISLRNLFELNFVERKIEGEKIIILGNALVFTNFMALRRMLLKAEDNVRVDFSNLLYLDYSVILNLESLKSELYFKGKQVYFNGIEHKP